MGVRLLLTVECKGCNVIGPENIFRLYCISCSNGACAFPINDSEMAHSCELEAGVVGKDSQRTIMFCGVQEFVFTVG